MVEKKTIKMKTSLYTIEIILLGRMSVKEV